MTVRSHVVALVLVALGAVVGVGGCASSDGSGSAADVVPPAEAVAAIEDGATVLDVRTPEEFAAGHLDGARNIDVSADDFEQRVQELDPDAAYVVYCRTGNRAATAVSTMQDLGFDDVVNGGGYEDLSAELA